MSTKNQPSATQKFEVYSNTTGKSVDMMSGSPRIEYRESMIDHTVRLSAAIVDTGNSLQEGNKTISASEALKLQGGEKVLFKYNDSRGNTLDLSKNTSLRLTNKSFEVKSFKSSSYFLQAVSKEFLDNKLLERRVTRKYSGKISDSVNTILKQDLKTDKDLFISPTINSISDYGLRMEPYEVILNLQQLSIPNLKDARGKTAGFFFWQTAKGFHFKSPDEIFSGKPVKKYIYNFKVDSNLPAGYDDKILEFTANRSFDVERQMDYGAYASVTETFDFYSQEYNKDVPLLADNANKVLAGKEIPNYGEYFKKPTVYHGVPKSIGMSYGTGDSVKLQLEKAKEENFNVSETIAQATQNYRQRLNYMIEIKIRADFSLHAGDLIQCDLPQLASAKTPERSPIDSGIYMILELCHFISPSAKSSRTDSSFYTGLVLVRDSYGIKI